MSEALRSVVTYGELIVTALRRFPDRIAFQQDDRRLEQAALRDPVADVPADDDEREPADAAREQLLVLHPHLVGVAGVVPGERDGGEAPGGRVEALLDVVGAQRGTDGALLDDVHGRRERARAEQQREVLRLLRVGHPRDLEARAELAGALGRGVERDPEVVGLLVEALRHQGGALSEVQLTQVTARLREAPRDALRLVALHHHLAAPPWRAVHKRPLRRRDRVLEVEDDRVLSLLEQCFTKFQDLDEPFWQARCFASLGFLPATRFFPPPTSAMLPTSPSPRPESM